MQVSLFGLSELLVRIAGVVARSVTIVGTATPAATVGAEPGLIPDAPARIVTGSVALDGTAIATRVASILGGTTIAGVRAKDSAAPRI